MTRPASASSGVHFSKQTTRRQDVTGKLLEDKAMNKFLFGSIERGVEYYEKAHDQLSKPLPVAHRKRVGMGQQRFRNQIGRVPMRVSGARVAAEGTQPSYWEPGMGYLANMSVNTRGQRFDRQLGRVKLYLAGMRGAPSRGQLGDSEYARPMSAMAALHGGEGNWGAPQKKPPAHLSGPKPHRGNLPVRHVPCPAMDKQLSREAWVSKPLRG